MVMHAAISTHPVVRTIEIGFLFEDGVAKVVAVEWSRGTTVLQALKSAARKPHGIRFQVTGDDGCAFVTEIDGQANDRIGNWM